MDHMKNNIIISSIWAWYQRKDQAMHLTIWHITYIVSYHLSQHHPFHITWYDNGMIWIISLSNAKNNPRHTNITINIHVNTIGYPKKRNIFLHNWPSMKMRRIWQLQHKAHTLSTLSTLSTYKAHTKHSHTHTLALSLTHTHTSECVCDLVN